MLKKSHIRINLEVTEIDDDELFEADGTNRCVSHQWRENEIIAWRDYGHIVFESVQLLENGQRAPTAAQDDDLFLLFRNLERVQIVCRQARGIVSNRFAAKTKEKKRMTARKGAMKKGSIALEGRQRPWEAREKAENDKHTV